MRRTATFLLATLVPAIAYAQSSRSTGLLFLDPSQYNSIPPAPPPLTGPLPASIDLSQYGYFPEPGDQGEQGSCVAWAVAYGMKSYQKNREFRLQNLPANFRFSPAFVYNQTKQDTCQGGSYIASALNVLESQGALPLDAFAYDPKDCNRTPSDAQIQQAWEYRIARWMRVNVQSATEMKSQVARGFPVVIAMKVHQSFVDWRGGGVYQATAATAGEYKGGHAMLVVGYADHLKAFKVYNSWGTGWGDKGYAWINYTTFQRLAVEGYVTIDIFMQHFTPVAMAQPPSLPAVRGLPTVKKIEPETTPVAAPAVRAAEIARKPELTPQVLAQSIRSTTKPNVLFKVAGLDVVPFSIWLDLPKSAADKIDRVEYWFNHPSFKNPKKSEPKSSVFLANWKGWGCVTDAKAIAFLKGGGKIETSFDLCEAQKRF